MGDVNVDIDKRHHPDVVCDIHHLPFPENTFDYVYCYHVLEHGGINPEKAIEELLRVSKAWVEIQVPHLLSPNAKADKTHVNFQLMRTKFWRKYNPKKVIVEYTSLFHIPFLLRPNNITINLKKEKRNG